MSAKRRPAREVRSVPNTVYIYTSGDIDRHPEGQILTDEKNNVDMPNDKCNDHIARASGDEHREEAYSGEYRTYTLVILIK